jgi:cellulose biosynthesis protein BcsQ
MFVIALYNLKGGVGKTASCVNFAHLAASDGFRTLLWDLDPQGAAGYYYHTESKTKSGIRKLLEKDLTLDELIQFTNYEYLDVIPADNSARKLDILLDEQKGSKKQIRQMLKQAKNNYDFVFIDCPPGFSVLADNIFEAADAILLPTIPTTLSVRTYEIVKEYFEDKDLALEKLMCFFTMVDSRKNLHTEVMQTLSADQRFFEHYIPYLSEVEKMGIHQSPVTAFAPSSRAAQCYRDLWTEIKEGVL